MKKNIEKFRIAVSFILCVILCAAVFCSCGKDDPQETKLYEIPEGFNFSTGEWVDNVYTNEVFGITLEKPEGLAINDWKRYLSLPEDATEEECQAAALEEFKYGMFDLANVSDENGNGIGVALYSRAGFEDIYSEIKAPATAEDYVQFFIKRSKELNEELDSKGTVGEMFKKDICGQTFCCYDVTGNDAIRYAYAVYDDYVLEIYMGCAEYSEGCLDELCTYFK